MFWSSSLLTTRGPLGKVWLAAQWGDKRLSRAQCAAADIDQAVEDIIKPQQPLALRTSGTLLLGCARIYELKLALLYTECTAAMKRLQTSSRKAAVDLPAAARKGTQKQLNRKAQTHAFGMDDDDESVVLGDMGALDDVLDDDFTLIKGTLNQAPLGDISLRAGDHTDLPEEGVDADDLFDELQPAPEALRAAGTPASAAASSAQVDDIDVLDTGLGDVASLASGASGAAGMGRRSSAAADAALAAGRASLAPGARESLGGLAEDDFQLGDLGDGLGDMDLTGMGGDAEEDLLVGGSGAMLAEATSDTEDGVSDLIVESETESQAEAAAAARAKAAATRALRRRKAAGAVRDSVLQVPSRTLKEWIGSTERHCLPRPLGRRRTRLARLHAGADAAAAVTSEEGFARMLQLPLGMRYDDLAPQLAAFFKAHASDNLPYPRRPEVELQNEIRAALGLPAMGVDAAGEGEGAVAPADEDDLGMGGFDDEDFPAPMSPGALPELDESTGKDGAGRPSLLDAALGGADGASVAPSVASSAAAGLAAEPSPLPSSAASPQAHEEAQGHVSTRKWHARTKRMAKVLASAMEAAGASGDRAEVSFSGLSVGSTKRTAASAFYEVLALATWDVVQVRQDLPYADITVGKTDAFDATVAALHE